MNSRDPKNLIGNIKLSSQVTVADYKKMEDGKDTRGLTDFIKERLTERYISSLNMDKKKKSGFLMMASCCLLIETLESFYQGLENTNGKSKQAFIDFFKRTTLASEFRMDAADFWKNVRNGILHQGESTGGWKIRRDGKLFDEGNLTINAMKFLKRIQKEVDRYCDELTSKAWEDQLWKNLRGKMKTIIKNCDP